MLSKDVLAKNPPSLTGYFSSAAQTTDELLKSATDVSMNGQRSNFRFGANTGVVFRAKDPNGAKDAVGFNTYRINGLLAPGNTGKLVSMNYDPGETLLADAIFQGSRFQAPTIVSMVSTARPPDSTLVGAQEAESAGSFAPVDPMASPDTTLTPDGTQPETQSGGSFGFSVPNLKFDNLNPKTGEEFLLPDPKDAGTPWGTNARTGTTKIDGSEFLKPVMPANTASGWLLKGLPLIKQDLSRIFKVKF